MSATFEEAIQPLLDAYAAINADVEEMEAELANLRDKRNRLRTAVRYLKPDAIPADKPKSSKNGSGGKGFGQETLQKVTEFIEGGWLTREFSGIDLVAAGVGFQVSTVNPVLRHLHQSGFLRLVRQGKGGLRTYEVIR